MRVTINGCVYRNHIWFHLTTYGYETFNHMWLWQTLPHVVRNCITINGRLMIGR